MRAIPNLPDSNVSLPPLTLHAAIRMQQRGISCRAIQAALSYGRIIRAKGVTYVVVGRKEVLRYAAVGVNLDEADGLQVLLASDGSVVTVYRNRDLHTIRVTPRRGRRNTHH